MFVETVKEGFLLVVDYGKSIRELVKGADCDYVSPVVNDENFPKGPSEHGRKWQHFVLYDFGGVVEEKYAAWRINHDGRRPAGIRELLCLAQVRSMLQFQCYSLIVPLGAAFKSKGGDSVLCLNHTACNYGVRRNLVLRLCDGRWEEGCQFLAVKPVDCP